MRERLEERFGQEHDERLVADDHAGSLLIGEPRVERQPERRKELDRPVEVANSPAFGHYHPASANGVRQPWAIIVLELKGDKIAAWNSFLDTEKLFPLFGLPPSLA